jgi:hypothetical protein
MSPTVRHVLSNDFFIKLGAPAKNHHPNPAKDLIELNRTMNYTSLRAHTSGPAASVYKVTWQDFGGGSSQVLSLLALLVQKYKYSRLLTAPIRETIAYGPRLH